MRIFPLFVKKIVQGAGAINYLSHVKAGIKVAGRNSGTAAKPLVRAGVRVKQAATTVVSRIKPGVRVTTSASGTVGAVTRVKAAARLRTVLTATQAARVNAAARVTARVVSATAGAIGQRVRSAVRVTTRNSGTAAKPQVKAGTRASVKNSGTPAKPNAKTGANVVQIVFNLTHESGGNAVAEYAVNGRTDWDAINNATGKKDGGIAVFDGSAVGARSGGIELSYADFPNKADLTITSVKLLYYFRIEGTVLGNAEVRPKYDRGAGRVTVALYTSDVDFMTNPLEVSLAGMTWTELDALKAGIECIADITETWGCDLDAIHVLITATHTQTV